MSVIHKDVSVNKGDRVNTKLGPGTVNYYLLEGPDYVKVRSFSIILDSRKDYPNYRGTIMNPNDVDPIK